ncbi:MAG: inositol monophosphatase family protein [bacterium]
MTITLDDIADLARSAGALGVEHFGHVKAERKGDGTLVTAADGAMQRLIVTGLRALQPDARALYILGEEDTEIPNPGVDDPREAHTVAAVDPLDGTTSFAAGLPLWGVSIGLLTHGRPAAGVVYMPLLGGSTGWMYRVDATGQAQRNGDELSVRPWEGWGKFSQVAVPSGFHRWARLQGFRGKLRSLGSTAHHVSLVAAGALDAAVIGRAHLWDLAAAAALLERAGGTLQTAEGKPANWQELFFDRMQDQPLLVGAPQTVASLAEILELTYAPRPQRPDSVAP